MTETTLRALDAFDDVPHGLFPMLVTSQDNEPHLRLGEWALVDPCDRELQFGELYVFMAQQETLVGQVLRADSGEEASIKIVPLGAELAHLSIVVPVDYARDTVIGRIVGVLAECHNMGRDKIDFVRERLGIRDRS